MKKELLYFHWSSDQNRIPNLLFFSTAETKGSVFVGVVVVVDFRFRWLHYPPHYRFFCCCCRRRHRRLSLFFFMGTGTRLPGRASRNRRQLRPSDRQTPMSLFAAVPALRKCRHNPKTKCHSTRFSKNEIEPQIQQNPGKPNLKDPRTPEVPDE